MLLFKRRKTGSHSLSNSRFNRLLELIATDQMKQDFYLPPATAVVISFHSICSVNRRAPEPLVSDMRSTDLWPPPPPAPSPNPNPGDQRERQTVRDDEEEEPLTGLLTAERHWIIDRQSAAVWRRQEEEEVEGRGVREEETKERRWGGEEEFQS